MDEIVWSAGALLEKRLERWSADTSGPSPLFENRLFAMLCKRYVDDSNMAIEAEIEEGTLRDTPLDQFVMEKVKAIANTIHLSTRATSDYGSKYDDNKLPTLDTKLWIGESATTGGMKIIHEHYMKDVSSRHVINYRSAHPEDMKINVLVNEALRIMRNCSEHLPAEETNKHLQYLMNRMQYSGYSETYRNERCRERSGLKRDKTTTTTTATKTTTATTTTTTTTLTTTIPTTMATTITTGGSGTTSRNTME